MTLNCPVNEVNKLQQTINGTGTLTLSQGCSAHSAALTLPAHDTIAQQPPLTIVPAPLNIKVALRPAERELLETLSKTNSIDSNGHDRPFLLEDVMSNLQPLQPEREDQSKASSSSL